MLKDPKIVEVRRMKLQTYLRLVVAQLSHDFPELVEHACRQTLIQTVPFFSYVSSVILFSMCYMFLHSESWPKGSSAFSVMSAVVDEERLG